MALVVLAWHVRRLPAVNAADVLALAYAIVIALYFVVPQDALGGEATTRGELLALRHHLFPVAAYALGRLASIAWTERGRLGGLIALTAVVVAVVGLLDLALISLQAWRDSGVPGWYSEQLGLDYEGLSGLPENWVYNTGDEENPIRRLVSTFLSPLASAYVLVVALIYVVSRPVRWWWALLAGFLYAALLFTHTRAAFAALAFGLVVLAIAQRRWAPAVLAASSVRRRRPVPRGLPVDRPVDELHGRGARVPARERHGGGACDREGAVPDGGRVDREPLGEPARRACAR